ncbi:MAG: SusC/RagA family TonB-linked outer membrane protein [Bacteroides sp.]
MRKFILLFVSLTVMSTQMMWAQSFRISGKVTAAEDHEPLIGASILQQGTTNGVITDIDGNYSLEIEGAQATLQFSYIGMKAVTKTVNTSSGVLNIALQSDTQLVDEVVVVAYGVRKKGTIAGSVSVVKGDIIENTPTASFDQALQGKSSGLTVLQNSGEPSSPATFQIRGTNSINAGTTPLFIMDGVAISADDFSSINPNDIESMTVLKGASAAALYGSRAANGAIMITTKKGKNDEKMKIDFTSNTTFSMPGVLPDFQNRYGQGWGFANSSLENGSWGPKLDGIDRVWGNVVDGEQLYKPYSAQKNNLKDFYETGVITDNSLAISGGKGKATYYMSYSNVVDNGILPGNSDRYRRNAISLKGSYEGKWLTSSANINYINRNTSTASSGQGYSVFNNLIQIPRDFSIVDMKDYTNKFYSPDNWYTPYGVINPYFNLNEDGNKYYEDRIFGNLELNGKILDCLTITWRIGGDLTNYRSKNWRAVMIPNGANTTDQKETGYVGERTGQSRELNSDLFANFNKQLSDDFHLSVLLGQNFNERYRKILNISVQGLDLPGFYNISNSATPPTKSSGSSLRRLMGIYGQIDLGFKNYLYLNVGARNDWSSTLPKDNNSFFYPTVGLSFVFTDAFESLKSFMSYGKVRASYGQTGNDVDPYMINGYYSEGKVTNPFGDGLKYPFGGVNAYSYGNIIGNPNLKSEMTKEYEVGLDLRFFQNRLGLDASFYNRETSDQIMPVDVTPSSGYTVQYMNLGSIRNRGVELTINAVPVKTKDFEWNLNFNWTLNRSKVVELGNGLEEFSIFGFADQGVSLLAIPGEPLGVFAGRGVMRDNNGNIVVDAESGLPKQSNKREIFGTSEYKYMMGVGSEFSYKDFTFGFNFDIRVGGLMYSRTKGTTFFVGNSPQTLYNDRQPFIVPGSVIEVENEDKTISYKENTTAIDHSYYDSYWNNNGGEFDRGDLIDKTYVKLKDIHLAYSFPTKWLSKANIKKIDLSVFAHNMWIWTPKSNNFVDPTVSNLGVDLQSEFGEFSASPSIKSVGFSIKASF